MLSDLRTDLLQLACQCFFQAVKSFLQGSDQLMADTTRTRNPSNMLAMSTALFSNMPWAKPETRNSHIYQWSDAISIRGLTESVAELFMHSWDTSNNDLEKFRPISAPWSGASFL